MSESSPLPLSIRSQTFQMLLASIRHRLGLDRAVIFTVLARGWASGRRVDADKVKPVRRSVGTGGSRTPVSGGQPEPSCRRDGRGRGRERLVDLLR